MDLKEKIALSLLAMVGFMGGWTVAVINYASSHNMPTLTLISGSATSAVASALLCGSALAGFMTVLDGDALRLTNRATIAECAVVFGSFAMGSLGITSALAAF